VPRLARLLRERRPRLVNAHYLTSHGVMSWLARRLAHPAGGGPPIVQTVWGDDLLVTSRRSWFHRQLARMALRGADLITGDSGDLRLEATRLAPRRPWHQFVFGPPAALMTAPRGGRRRILSTRLLIPAMRVDRVIAAFASLRAADRPWIRDWELVVAGDGPERDALVSGAAGDPALRFVGMVSHAELMELLLDAAVAVSIPESDATSAGLLEALAAGAIPVVTDLPANREWVTAATGEFVPPNPTIAEVAAAIERAATQTRDPQSIRASVSGHTWDEEVDRLVDAFDRLVPRRVVHR
jgi:glycosyltransferase involved in cell wall biosynthesis